MKLLEYILTKLLELEEITTAEELSQLWCKKNKNWASWQKHAGQDFSVDAGINCLHKIRLRIAERSDKAGQRGLCELEQLLADYLRHKFKISEITNNTA